MVNKRELITKARPQPKKGEEFQIASDPCCYDRRPPSYFTHLGPDESEEEDEDEEDDEDGDDEDDDEDDENEDDEDEDDEDEDEDEGDGEEDRLVQRSTCCRTDQHTESKECKPATRKTTKKAASSSPGNQTKKRQ